MFRQVKRHSITFVLIGLLPAFVAETVRADSWSFARVVEYAGSHSPEAAIARSRIEVAQAQLGQANAMLWPRVQLQGGYTQTNNPVAVFGNLLNQKSYSQSLDFNDVPRADDLTARGALSFPLYTGGRDSAKIAASTAGLEAAKFDAKTIQRDLSVQAAITFVGISKAVEFIKAIESSVRAFEVNEKAAKARLSSGAALRTELLDIQVQLAQAREDLLRARNSKALLLLSLRSLLALEDISFLVKSDLVILSEPTSGAEGIVRTEVQAIHSQKEASDAEIREARAGYLPRISIQGSYQYNKGWESGNDGTSYTGGIVGEWDLWDGQLTARKEDEARARLRALQEAERRLSQTISLEEQEARIRLQEAKDTYGIAIGAEKLARESADLTRMRFSQGLAPSTQLIGAEHALTNAEVRRAEALANQQIAIINLGRALGLTPLEFSKDNL